MEGADTEPSEELDDYPLESLPLLALLSPLGFLCLKATLSTQRAAAGTRV
jgi:hypothetical protein